MTDAELDAGAKAFAAKHSVSYADALSAVVTFREAAPQAAGAVDWEVLPGESDAQLDAKAKVYAAQHAVSYAEALASVASFREAAPQAAAVSNGSDAQLDAKAKAFAAKHRVSYAEALSAAVTFREAAPQAAGAVDWEVLPGESDAQLDAKAKVYAAQHAVSYLEALAVVTFLGAAPQAAALPNDSDAELDAKAKAFAAKHRVSYAEALSAAVTFREAAPQAAGAVDWEVLPGESDAQLDAKAKAYAAQHAVSYAEALSAVSPDGGLHVLGIVSFREAALPVLFAQPIEIFRAGEHTDSAGNLRTFSRADVQAIADAYRPAKHEAPFTLGHIERDDRPAYGWVQALEVTPDGRLLAHAQRVDSDFAEWVESGYYKKRSAAFYQPASPGNPTPGQWYLRHVAWLGATPPAIKGLADLTA